ncbi:unnamed protein product [Ranitomeya imitator]|uniref:Helix-turn-helix domain-containing protein n=1 Tax=Ranitomeya imitator TaxID=111125 RepID=A0ABN9M0A9_9NEOB|nr:unnamed protein product [Ranitomeya imitator]
MQGYIKPTKGLKADKGGNIVLWPNSLYLQEVGRQLGDPTCYLHIPADPTDFFKEKLDQLIGQAADRGILSKKEVDFLTTEFPVTPTFYLLPKVHKSLVNPPGWWEESVVYKHVAFRERCLKWLRFIDDIVMFWAGTEEDCERFIADLNDNPHNIRLTSHISRTSVEFLDLKVSLAGPNVVTTLYRKPTATNSLLHYSSFHPRHLKNGIPTGQFLRLKKKCSLISDFQDEARILTDRFRYRGYPKKKAERNPPIVFSNSSEDILMCEYSHNLR